MGKTERSNIYSSFSFFLFSLWKNRYYQYLESRAPYLQRDRRREEKSMERTCANSMRGSQTLSSETYSCFVWWASSSSRPRTLFSPLLFVFSKLTEICNQGCKNFRTVVEFVRSYVPRVFWLLLALDFTGGNFKKSTWPLTV